MKLKTNKNVVYSFKHHVIWCTKYRRDILKGKIELRLNALIKKKCDELKAEIIELSIMPDHVHLLVEVDPQLGIHRLVKWVKGLTSRVLRKEFRECRTRVPTLWTNSYCVISAGGAPIAVIRKYIENQKNT